MSEDGRSLAALIGDLTDQAGTLLRTEVRLLRAELSEKLGKAGTAATEILGGAICLLAALMVLLQALVVALAQTGLGIGWASLIVGVAVALLGILLLRSGKAGLDPVAMKPQKTLQQLEKDARTVKEQAP